MAPRFDIKRLAIVQAASILGSMDLEKFYGEEVFLMANDEELELMERARRVLIKSILKTVISC